LDRMDENSYEDRTFSDNEGSFRKHDKLLSGSEHTGTKKLT